MEDDEQFKLRVFELKSPEEFSALALEIFRFQYKNNIVYKTFVDGVCHDINTIEHYSHIPFLPVEFFKTHKVTSVSMTPEIVFHSSGTAGMTKSIHYVFSEDLFPQKHIKEFFVFLWQSCRLSYMRSYS